MIAPLKPDVERIRELRETRPDLGFYSSVDQALREAAEKVIREATTVEDLKPFLLALLPQLKRVSGW